MQFLRLLGIFGMISAVCGYLAGAVTLETFSVTVLVINTLGIIDTLMSR